MVTTATTTATNTWEGTSVDVVGIEGALGELWKRVGHDEGADGRQQPARTGVFNLVVYVPRAELAPSVTATIAGLIERHPSRTIVVVADPGAPSSSLDAAVATNCTPSAGESRERFCWEQITVTAHGDTAARAPGIVIPLLLPDLPTYLWWADDVLPFEDEFFARMADLCDRVIVDSARLSRPIDGLSRLAALSRAAGEDRGASDLHWARLTPWRNLVAQFFDKADLRPYLGNIDGVRIAYAHTDGSGGGQGTPAQALLAAGWLASCLGWTPRPAGARRRDGALRLEAARPGGDATVTIDIAPGDGPGAGAPAGEVLSLALTATLDDAPATFTVERHAEDSEMATTTTTAGASADVPHAVRLAARGDGELLNEELDVFRHDRAYEDAISAVAALCARLGKEEKA